MRKIEELEKRINELTEESRARTKLKITEQEKQEKEKEVLEAVSREYTLDPKHTLALDYSLSYDYSPALRSTSPYVVEDVANHTLQHSISTSYSILDNMAVTAYVPFLYRYYRVGTADELDETDIGDISFGTTFQPVKATTGQIRTTINVGASLPTGKSPYKINPETELSTGSGTYAFSLTGSFSKQVDPVVAFWNLGYTYRMDIDGLEYNAAENVVLEEVELGDIVSFGGGLAYSLSYKVSVNASFRYTYTYSTNLIYRAATQKLKLGDDTSASITLGMGWRATQKTLLSISVGYDLADSGFTLTFRAPFNFIL